MAFLNRLCRLINRVFLIFGGLSVLALTFLATGNVLLRVFDMPFRWTYEIVSFLGAMITAFSLGYTQRQKDHIIVDIVSSRYPEKVRNTLDVVNYITVGIFFSIVSWHLFKWALRLKDSGELSENLQIVYYPFVMAMAAGFAAYALTLFVDFLNCLLPIKEDRA